MPCIVLAPPNLADASVALAASRVGAIGVADLSYAAGDHAIACVLQNIARATPRSCGIRVGRSGGGIARVLADDLPEAIGTVIAPAAALLELRPAIARLGTQGVSLLLEVVTQEEAAEAERGGADGLIARGSEAGGWVGEDTTFILLQRMLGRTRLPVWAQGGISLHTAAACHAAGAAGVVLDSQLWLTRESRLPDAVRAAIARMDGSETACLGDELGAPFRVYARPGVPVLEELAGLAARLMDDPRPRAQRLEAWRRAVEGRVGWDSNERSLWPLGQDAAFAAGLARRFATVGGVVSALREAVRTHLDAARRLRPLDEHGPLAQSQGTRYPVLQGPMTRVSDVPAFAAAVADAGALPFLALALLRGHDVRVMLTETRKLLGDRPWGVGILGFVPVELRQEQLDVVREFGPSVALIAGGRSDQARELERVGIRTYLHVPSPGLLRMFLRDGARRFIFEGRECGGHVGPRSSFVLWSTMVDVLLEELPNGHAAEECHIVFAGGIHDALSASMVASIASPLVERGMKVGVLLGTGYLFTHEAVATGAIRRAFQEEAVRCTGTALLETAPGHATRCAVTPFVGTFQTERRRLHSEGRSRDDIRRALEALNLGRLRIASKAIRHEASPGDLESSYPLVEVPADVQRGEGMYMMGQLAAVRERVCSIEELHRDVTVEACTRLAEVAVEVDGAEVTPTPCDIAIIGMSCMFPKAPTLDAYWANIVSKLDAISEIPPDRFDWRLYYDPDPKARDKIYSKCGGFLEPVRFDPARYGMPPATLSSIEPVQILVLEAVQRALEDAGYAQREFCRVRTGVVVGVGGGVGDLGQKYGTRAALPMLVRDPGPEVLAQLPEWTEDSFAGIIANVTAGRVANRFDLRGVNYAVDAACASSLAALYAGVRELEMGTADMMIIAGADTVQNPFGYLCFSKTRALSPQGRCRAFDEAADGTVISEGVGVVALKRVADAERDGDRIYAVIKSVAGASDGRGLSLTAPSPGGQVMTLRRAYQTAGVSPHTVGLIEGHGTGTVAGDQAEIAALRNVFGDSVRREPWCAVGSVKSMIGHSKCAAGLAGLIKITKAVYHCVLPPTLGVERPNQKARFGDGPFYVNSETRPWVQVDDLPRRAGVSSFGFGGTNFHAVVEEYRNRLPCEDMPAPLDAWPAELVVLSGETREELVAAADALVSQIAPEAERSLGAVAAGAWADVRSGRRPSPGGEAWTLSVVATSTADLRVKLGLARQRLADGVAAIDDRQGIYFAAEPLARSGSVAFAFPGQGSQSPDMLRDLCIHFHEVRECFERASRVLADRFPRPLASYVFPPPRFSEEAERACEEALKDTRVAQPSLGAAGMGVMRLLAASGVRASAMAGHSYGEYLALCAAGAFSEEVLYALSEERGRAIVETVHGEPGAMAAVQAGHQEVNAALGDMQEVWLANVNAPRQAVISGTRRGVAAAIERLASAELSARAVPVSCAFHTPLMRDAAARFADYLNGVTLGVPAPSVFSNTLATAHGTDPERIAATLVRHMAEPVLFADEVEAMYAAGCRIFVETGPRNVLTGFVRQILAGRPFVAVPVDVPGRHGLVQLLHALGQLAAHGVPVSLDRVFAGRAKAERDAGGPRPARTWLVTGGGVRPEQNEPLGSGQSGKDEPKPSLPIAAAGEPTADRPSAPETAGAAAPVSVAARVGADMKRMAERGAPAGSARVPGTDGAASTQDVVLQFQRTMSRFLDVQRNVMLAYLRQGAGAAAGAHPRAEATLQVATRRAPAPLAMRETAEGASGATGTEVAPPADTGAAAPDALDPGWLQEALLRIASERTGYPADMLDLDANMEADLGIDSIKRVEILGLLKDVMAPALGERLSTSLETLTRAKTLRSILEEIPRCIAAPADGSTAATSPAAIIATEGLPAPPAAPAELPSTVPRFVLTTVDRPIAGPATLRLPPGQVLVTDDERGVATFVVSELRRLGARTILVRPGKDIEGIEALDADTYRVRFEDAERVTRLVEQLRAANGPVGGLVHLAPLALSKATDPTDVSAWSARLAADVKAFFYLLRATGADIAGTTAGFVLAATGLGGAFGNSGDLHGGSPGHGGVAGLVKTLAVEWAATRCKVVDVALDAEPVDIGRRMIEELAVEDGEVEIGWEGSRRLGLRLDAAPDPGNGRGAPLDRDAVVLVTGGARGITSAVTEEIAQLYRPTLVLVGRLPLPAAVEAAETAGLQTPRELKAALIADLRRTGGTPVAAEVEVAYRRLLRDREVRQRLAALRETGATVVYRQVDVRDPAALETLVDELYRVHGRIDGVIHGAGLIEDKLVLEKTPASFDRVFDTKVVSAFVLAKALRPETLRFLVFFSSVAGRWGNRGQADYVAANEVLNKLACYLDGVWPTRVVALNWGPWSGGGMVSDEVARQFLERGVRLVPWHAGARSCVREIESGEKGRVEIVLGGGPWEQVAVLEDTGVRTAGRPVNGSAGPPAVHEDRCPLLDGNLSEMAASGTVEARRIFDPAADDYLNDHTLDGKPVLPAALMAELMAEVVQSSWPQWTVVGLQAFRVLHGVVLGAGPMEIRVVARAQAPASASESEMHVDVTLFEPDREQPSYRVTVELGRTFPEPPTASLTEALPLAPFPLATDRLYREWLFHGPRFQCIEAVAGMTGSGMLGVLRPSDPATWMSRCGGGGWVFDPVLLDGGLQLALLWTRATWDVSALPAGFAALRLFRRPGDGPVRCELKALAGSTEHAGRFDLVFALQDGSVLAILEGLEATGSRQLNRMMGWREQPGSTRSYLTSGDQHLAAKEYDAALREYGHASRSSPDLGLTCYKIGNVFFEQERYEEAVRHYRMALEMRTDVDVTACHHQLGKAYFALGRLEEAASAYRAALAALPRCTAASYDVADTLHAQGRFREAIAEYGKALALDAEPAPPTDGPVRAEETNGDAGLEGLGSPLDDTTDEGRGGFR